jgi:uncharacterized protein
MGDERRSAAHHSSINFSPGCQFAATSFVETSYEKGALTMQTADDRFRADMNEADQEEQARRFKGPGGTPGGVGMFVFGLALAIGGGYLIMTQVQVTSGYWNWWGPNTFGLTLLPLVIGIGLLFFNGKSIAGWVLAGGGAVIIFLGILSSLEIHFRSTNLFNTIVMLTLFAGGLGLMARAVRHS